MKWERKMSVRKNVTTYTVSAYINNRLIWCENEILLKYVLKYGFTEQQLPQNENEVKWYNVKLEGE